MRNKRRTNPPKTIIKKILSLFSNPKWIAKTPNTKLIVENIKP
jgi:hypothetical protein